MKFKQWFDLRGSTYIFKRAVALLGRYSFTPSRAIDRVENCMAKLAEYGCSPTLPTPGRVVQRYPKFIRHLQEIGAEIAVHSYDHVDLCLYPPIEAREQLIKAAQVFARHGINVSGFRCPYLSFPDALFDSLPNGVFDYNSNKAIRWDTFLSADICCANNTFRVLQQLYNPISALDTVCTPRMRYNMVEIPVCLPDDIELIDALSLSAKDIARTWTQILLQTHRRGELFDILFHPELARLCQQPLVEVLREAICLQPKVWLARLQDISNWWREKSNFSVEVSNTMVGLRISFICSERATILVKGLNDCISEQFQDPKTFEYWDGSYYQLKTKTRTLLVPNIPRPFVGLPVDAPESVVSFLREQGYILEIGEKSKRCGIFIDSPTLAGLTNEVDLISFIEELPGPLIRYWRWPDGAKSALCITGDLDALTLFDYADRLFVQ